MRRRRSARVALAGAAGGKRGRRIVALARPPRTRAGHADPSAREPHFANVWQLTFGGENAEAYWSPDGKQLDLPVDARRRRRATRSTCMDARRQRTCGGSRTGKGRTTCALLLCPAASAILYASTHAVGRRVPAAARLARRATCGPLYPSYDIFTREPRRHGSEAADRDARLRRRGDGLARRQADRVHLDARRRPRALHDGRSTARDVKRLTNELGYDGGAFFSPDGKRIVYRADIRRRRGRLGRLPASCSRRTSCGPTQLEICASWTPTAANKRQVTTQRRAPTSRRTSTPTASASSSRPTSDDPKGRELRPLPGRRRRQRPRAGDLRDPTFDGFPMFTPDGKRLVFASNRNAKERGETNLFVADWKDAAATK